MLSKISNKLKDNTNVLLIGGAVTAIAALYHIPNTRAYLFATSSSNEDSSNDNSMTSSASNVKKQNKEKDYEEKTPLENQEEQKTSFNPQNELKKAFEESKVSKEQKIKDFAKKIQVNFNEQLNCLDISTIFQIFDSITELSGEEYSFLTLESRNQRRSLRNKDLQGYLDAVVAYNNDSEMIMEEVQDKVMQEMNISKELFENSLGILIQSGLGEQIFMMNAAMRQKMKEFIRAKNPISLDKVKEVFRFQIEALESEKEIFKSLIYKLYGPPESMQIISMAINTILQDLMYEAYGIEEEDQMEAMKSPQIMMDQEIRELFPIISQAIEKLFAECGVEPQMQGNEFEGF